MSLDLPVLLVPLELKDPEVNLVLEVNKDPEESLGSGDRMEALDRQAQGASLACQDQLVNQALLAHRENREVEENLAVQALQDPEESREAQDQEVLLV